MLGQDASAYRGAQGSFETNAGHQKSSAGMCKIKKDKTSPLPQIHVQRLSPSHRLPLSCSGVSISVPAGGTPLLSKTVTSTSHMLTDSKQSTMSFLTRMNPRTLCLCLSNIEMAGAKSMRATWHPELQQAAFCRPECGNGRNCQSPRRSVFSNEHAFRSGETGRLLKPLCALCKFFARVGRDIGVPQGVVVNHGISIQP